MVNVLSRSIESCDTTSLAMKVPQCLFLDELKKELAKDDEFKKL